MTIAYAERPKDAPTQCPCITCHDHGSYCAVSCALFEAWERAGKPGRTSSTQPAKPQGA